jgi:hypothetical protein
LEARVRELEDKLNAGRERRRRYWDETRDDARSLSDRKVDEAARLFTGAVRAALEGIRVVAEAASSLVEETLESSIPEPGEDSASVASRLPANFVRASMHSAQAGLDAPSRAADQFNRAFSDEGGARSERISGDKDPKPASGASEPPSGAS